MSISQDFIDLKAWLDKTRDDPLEQMAGFFDLRIGDYEAHMARWSRHYAKLAALLPDGIETLLDLGCGSGLELDEIYRRFPRLAVTGVDLSAKMLRRLSEKHAGKSPFLVQADYFRYEPGENRFDAAVAFQTLHHFPAEKKSALFRKIYRCLKPDGVYLECDYIAVSDEIEALTAAECRRRRVRDGVPETVFVHFDTPLTVDHELVALRNGGFSTVELIGFLPDDAHTALFRAVK